MIILTLFSLLKKKNKYYWNIFYKKKNNFFLYFLIRIRKTLRDFKKFDRQVFIYF